jgi:hypothetical protein
MKIKQPWLFLGFVWSLLWTIVGFGVALFGWCRYYRFEPEDWTFHYIAKPGGLYMWWAKKRDGSIKWAGSTMGAVICYSKQEYADSEHIRHHERIHSWQCYKAGLFKPILYVMATLVAWFYGQDYYRGNDGEEQARFLAGEVPMPDDIKPRV